MNQTELPWLGEIEPIYYFIVKYQEWDAGEYNEIAACIDNWERALEYFHKKKALSNTIDAKIFKAGITHWSYLIKGYIT